MRSLCGPMNYNYFSGSHVIRAVDILRNSWGGKGVGGRGVYEQRFMLSVMLTSAESRVTGQALELARSYRSIADTLLLAKILSVDSVDRYFPSHTYTLTPAPSPPCPECCKVSVGVISPTQPNPRHYLPLESPESQDRNGDIRSASVFQNNR